MKKTGLAQASFIFLVFNIIVGCTNVRHEIPNKEPVTYSKAVIFIPGFKGSYLLDENNNPIWITASKGLFGSSANLMLDNPTLGLKNKLSLKTGSLLKKVPIIPGIFSIAVYGEILKSLEEHLPDSKIVEFAYDWRQDNIVAVRALATTIQNLKKEGIHSISIVSHSMGGLIAAYYLRYGDQEPESASENWEGAKHIQKTIWAGTPFLGSITILDDFQNGSYTGINTTILSADVYSSFPSSYQLLPSGGSKQILLNTNLANDALLKTEVWESLNIGFFSTNSNLSPERLPKAKMFISEQLNRAREFRNLIIAPLRTLAPKKLSVLNIIGDKFKTPARAKLKVEREQPFIEFNCRECFEPIGDGVVTTESSTLPPGYLQNFELEKFYSSNNHKDLLSGDQNIEAIVTFLNK